MIRVAYIVSTLKRSGPTNQLSYIIKYLDKSKFQPIIITLSPEPEDSLLNYFDELGIECISLNLSRIKGIFKGKSELLKILKEKKIDLIHTQGIRADILSSKHLKGYKRISTLRNYPYNDYPMKFGKVKGWLMAINHIEATRKIKNSIACSESIAKIYNEKHSLDISYIQNGVDQTKFYRDDNKLELRKKLNLPLDKKIYVSVGSLIPRKDPITIIRAFNNMEDNENRKLVFLGNGFLKDNCLNEIGKNKNIKLLGNVTNVNEYLQAADYLVSSSKAEGLPNTVIEAMACGLPCILSDIQPHREILNFDCTAGRIFELGNNKDLIEKIDEIENKNYKFISDNSVKLIENNLNAKLMSEKYQKIYLTLSKSKH